MSWLWRNLQHTLGLNQKFDPVQEYSAPESNMGDDQVTTSSSAAEVLSSKVTDEREELAGSDSSQGKDSPSIQKTSSTNDDVSSNLPDLDDSASESSFEELDTSPPAEEGLATKTDEAWETVKDPSFDQAIDSLTQEAALPIKQVIADSAQKRLSHERTIEEQKKENAQLRVDVQDLRGCLNYERNGALGTITQYQTQLHQEQEVILKLRTYLLEFETVVSNQQGEISTWVERRDILVTYLRDVMLKHAAAVKELRATMTYLKNERDAMAARLNAANDMGTSAKEQAACAIEENRMITIKLQELEDLRMKNEELLETEINKHQTTKAQLRQALKQVEALNLTILNEHQEHQRIVTMQGVQAEDMQAKLNGQIRQLQLESQTAREQVGNLQAEKAAHGLSKSSGSPNIDGTRSDHRMFLLRDTVRLQRKQLDESKALIQSHQAGIRAREEELAKRMKIIYDHEASLARQVEELARKDAIINTQTDTLRANAAKLARQAELINIQLKGLAKNQEIINNMTAHCLKFGTRLNKSPALDVGTSTDIEYQTRMLRFSTRGVEKEQEEAAGSQEQSQAATSSTKFNGQQHFIKRQTTEQAEQTDKIQQPSADQPCSAAPQAVAHVDNETNALPEGPKKIPVFQDNIDNTDFERKPVVQVPPIPTQLSNRQNRDSAKAELKASCIHLRKEILSVAGWFALNCETEPPELHQSALLGAYCAELRVRSNQAAPKTTEAREIEHSLVVAAIACQLFYSVLDIFERQLWIIMGSLRKPGVWHARTAEITDAVASKFWHAAKGEAATAAVRQFGARFADEYSRVLKDQLWVTKEEVSQESKKSYDQFHHLVCNLLRLFLHTQKIGAPLDMAFALVVVDPILGLRNATSGKIESNYVFPAVKIHANEADRLGETLLEECRLEMTGLGQDSSHEFVGLA